jgi:alkanesulfonate monooxygenase SsuD/methylene tetrahydromethanopterin reductase-like flavin-dependent oxidoreductase (luciferase family)
MERIGFATGYDRKAGVREMREWARQADEAGFEIVFFSETIELMRDSVSALAGFALETERTTIGCTQIVRLRSPLVMAQTLATLDELSGGRVLLSPGACTNTHADRHGLPHGDPVMALEEYVEAIRLLLTGERTTYRGEFVCFQDVELGFHPTRSRIPMLIAATSRTGLRAAGRFGDGVVLNATCSPEYDENAIRILKDSAEKAGRNPDDLQIAQIINCSIEDDHRSALDSVRWEVASKLDPVQIPFIMGPKTRVGEPYMRPEDVPTFEAAWQRGGMDALIEAVPDTYVEGMTASGTPDEVVARVQRYREAGVQLPILRAAQPHQVPRLIELFAQRP